MLTALAGGVRTRRTVLWWGRYDPEYARNAILRECFDALGWSQATFRPGVSTLGDLQAVLRRPVAADLVWVPCFRQRDIAAAARYARRTGARLCVDPLISAYDKQVDERGKLDAGGVRAGRLLHWERSRLALADRVIADTAAHASYFRETLGVAAERLSVVPVGAQESRFRPTSMPTADAGVEALFFGSFLPLQGPETIVRAAGHLSRDDVRITLLGDGPLRPLCERLAREHAGVTFESWLPYEQLPERIARAHMLFGALGATPKANRVIPNKVYQGLACARPMITRTSDAYPRGLVDGASTGLQFVAPNDPEALADAVAGIASDREALVRASRSAREIYDSWFGESRVRSALASALDALFPSSESSARVAQ